MKLNGINRKFSKRILIILFILILFIGYFLHDCTFPKGGSMGTSENINESQYIGAFVCEYKPEKKQIRIDNKYEFIINEVWLERTWIYSEHYRSPVFETLSSCYYAFIITTESNNLSKHGINWNLDKFNSQYANPDKGQLILRILYNYTLILTYISNYY